MDIGGVRLAPAAAIIPAANRVEPTSSATKAVATELPRTDAVRALPDATRVQFATRQNGQPDKQREQAAREQALRDFIQKRNIVDPRTREIIFRSVDIRTGDVIQQFPDELRLKMREYVSQMREAAAENASTGETLQRSA